MWPSDCATSITNGTPRPRHTSTMARLGHAAVNGRTVRRTCALPPDRRARGTGESRGHSHPPAASMVDPVRQEASGDNRKATIAAISSDSASRPRAFIDAAILSGSTPWSARGLVLGGVFGGHVGGGTAGSDRVDGDPALGQ